MLEARLNVAGIDLMRPAGAIELAKTDFRQHLFQYAFPFDAEIKVAATN
jgi:hypothetical protein